MLAALVAGWLLQYAVIPHLVIGRAVPDVPLIIVAVYSFMDGPVAGSLAGFVSGFLADLVSARVLGIQLLSKTLTGYLSGMLERMVFGSTVLLVGAAIFLISLASQTVYILVAFVFGEAIEVTAAARDVVVPSAVYTSLVSVLVFKRLSAFLGRERRATVFK